LALVFGGTAAVGINSMRGQSSDTSEKVTLVVALADIPRGKSLSRDLLRTREYPKDLAPEGALLTPEEALDRTLLVPLTKDEPLIESKLASRNAGRGLAPLVPDGMRACTITTNIASSVAGLVIPGNHVDVLLTITNNLTNDLTGGGSTTTLLQDVEILAVDQRMDSPPDHKVDPNLRSVTLLVTQAQAAKLALGQDRGRLQLTLRNPDDHKATNARHATLAEIQFHQERPWDEKVKGVLEYMGKTLNAKKDAKSGEPKTAPPEPPAPSRIRTLRGSQDGVVYIEPGESATRRP